MNTTTTEMLAATDDLVLPLGVRDDGTPIRIPQYREPNLAIFGGASSGKSVLLSQIIKAAARQGAAVIVADTVGDPGLRKLAHAGLPGLVHYSAGCDAALHRTVKYTLDELDRRAMNPDQRYAPMLLVLHEITSWLHGLIQHGYPEAPAAAEVTLARINRVAAQGREHRVHLLTVGQLAPGSVFGGAWLSNTATVAVLGQPTEHQLRSLFPAEQLDRVRNLSSQIGRGERGRGVVLNAHTDDVDLFRTRLDPAGDAEAAHEAAAPRFGWRFPTGDERGADGTWQDWTPVSEPSSDSLPVIPLDGPDAEVFDPTSREYRPGAPLRRIHLN